MPAEVNDVCDEGLLPLPLDVDTAGGGEVENVEGYDADSTAAAAKIPKESAVEYSHEYDAGLLHINAEADYASGEYATSEDARTSVEFVSAPPDAAAADDVVVCYSEGCEQSVNLVYDETDQQYYCASCYEDYYGSVDLGQGSAELSEHHSASVNEHESGELSPDSSAYASYEESEYCHNEAEGVGYAEEYDWEKIARDSNTALVPSNPNIRISAVMRDQKAVRAEATRGSAYECSTEGCFNLVSGEGVLFCNDCAFLGTARKSQVSTAGVNTLALAKARVQGKIKNAKKRKGKRGRKKKRRRDYSI